MLLQTSLWMETFVFMLAYYPGQAGAGQREATSILPAGVAADNSLLQNFQIPLFLCKLQSREKLVSILTT